MSYHKVVHNQYSDYMKSLTSVSKINPIELKKQDQMLNITRFMNEKQQNPKLSKKKLCERLNISPSSLDRSLKDLNVGSLYRFEKPGRTPFGRDLRSKTKENSSKENSSRENSSKENSS